MTPKNVFLLLVPLVISAADPPYATKLRDYFQAPTGSDAAADLLEELLEPARAAKAHIDLTNERRLRQTLDRFERGRADEDLSSGGRADGGTAVASVAGIVNSISAAVENGAFTQTTSGTVSTIRVKPIAIYDAFAGKGLEPCAQYLVITKDRSGQDCATLTDRYLKGLSAAVSLDNSRSNTVEAQPAAAVTAGGTTVPVPANNGDVLSFLTQRRAVNSWSVRYELYTHRDPRSAAFLKKWTAALDSAKPAADKLALALNASFKAITPQADYKAWARDTRAKLEAARPQGWSDLEKAWREQLDAFVALESIKSSAELRDAVTKASEFVSAQNAALREELNKPIFSVEYTNLRPLNQPDTSNIRLLISKPFWTDRVAQGGQEGMFSFNFGANLYNTVPAGAKVGRLRDVQAALQWDVPIGASPANKPAVFTLAAYYQYQIEPGLIVIGAGEMAPNTSIPLPSDATTLLSPKGGIFIAQAKLTLNAGNTKAKIPAAITWANRTELIKAPEIRGNIGFLFDWDALWSRDE